jgi:hypothetical protein
MYFCLLICLFTCGLFKRVVSYSYKTNKDLGTACGAAVLNLRYYSDSCLNVLSKITNITPELWVFYPIFETRACCILYRQEYCPFDRDVYDRMLLKWCKLRNKIGEWVCYFERISTAFSYLNLTDICVYIKSAVYIRVLDDYFISVYPVLCLF